MNDGFGKYDVYTTAGSIYCYRDSNVLKNRLGIQDHKELKVIEANLFAIRQNDLLTHPIQGRFSARHLCRIHQYLFGDVYPFAGHFRREDIMKGSTRFLAHQEIKQKLTALLASLKGESYLSGLSFEDFIKRSSYYFSELNYIHPFREGNGRSTREFMRLLFDYNQYRVTWNAVDTERLLFAMEMSVFNTAELEAVLALCVSPKGDLS